MENDLRLRALLKALSEADEDVRGRILRTMPPPDLRAIDQEWSWQAHGGQQEPEGDWRVWMLIAGRGFGKTRAGAEWIGARAREGKHVRIALAGASVDDVAKVMVHGPSGLIASARTGETPIWVDSRATLIFASGAEAYAYSGERPGKLRGPEHHYAWCDELAKWGRPDEAWDNLQMGVRIGDRPRTIVTTTPRPIPLLKRIAALERTQITRGRSAENMHLPEDFRTSMEAIYGGTRLGRQELNGELIEDFEGALWTRNLIERCRTPASAEGGREYACMVIGVDPPATAAGDACGIIAVGLGRDGIGYVLGDHSVRGLSPEGWAGAVANAADIWGADRVIAEANNGGEMVESVLRGVEISLPVKLVHASKGKGARAEPVAALFEKGRAKFAGTFPALEDELAGLCSGGEYHGPGRSPDRADACVWALTELMLKMRREPRIVRL